jgi:plastocyanin
MRKAVATIALALALAGTACSSGGGSSSSGGSGGGSPSGGCTADSATALSGDVTIQSFAFHPDCFSVSAGTQIEVQNEDTTTHTFTVDGTDVNVSLDGGSKKDATAPDPGTYAFHCNIHPTMTGTLIVS